MTINTNTMLHVRFAGRSFDVPARDLDLALGSSDTQIKQALARRLEVDSTQLNDYCIDRHSNGNLTLRPEAIFG